MHVPKTISDEVALLLGDVLPTGYFCAFQSEVHRTPFEGLEFGLKGASHDPQPSNSVAVLGCGPVGLMAVLSAIHLGGSPVFALDTRPERLQLAQQFGAIPLQIPRNSDGKTPGEIINAKTGNRGVDCVCEAVGSQAAVQDGFKYLRPGGILSSVGVHTEQNFTGFNPIEGYDKNITYKSGRCSARVFMNAVLDLVETGGWAETIPKIITHRVDLRDEEAVQRSYDLFNNQKENCIKVVFTL